MRMVFSALVRRLTYGSAGVNPNLYDNVVFILVVEYVTH